MTEDHLEMFMWESDVIVTSDQLKSYAANFPPMGVYIPRGRIKVPHRRSGATSQISQSAKGKPNSPNLLMIKPTFSKPLPANDVYVTRRCDVKIDSATSLHPTSSTRAFNHDAQQRFRIKVERLPTSRMFDPVTSQMIYSGSDANNGMLQYSKLMNNEPLPHLTVQSVLPPPHVNHGDGSYSGVSNHPKPCNRDVTTLMTQDMGHPLGQHYYQHLSAIAAMAWSNCNQATEKFRRIYEETAHLSRSHDPFGVLCHTQTPHQPPVYIGASSSVSDPKDSSLHHNVWGSRYHHLAKGRQKSFGNQAMAQSKIQNKYANLGMLYDVHKKADVMTAVSPLPGIALLDSQPPQHSNVPCDVTNQRNCSRLSAGFPPKAQSVRQKRKLSEQQDLYGAFGALYDQQYHAKLPRMNQSTQGFYFDNASTSQSFCDAHPFLTATLCHPETQPQPPDAFLQGGLQHPIPDLLKKVTKTPNFASVIHDSLGDVAKTPSRFTERLCLPSVSYSPSDSCLNFPFVMQ